MNNDRLGTFLDFGHQDAAEDDYLNLPKAILMAIIFQFLFLAYFSMLFLAYNVNKLNGMETGLYAISTGVVYLMQGIISLIAQTFINKWGPKNCFIIGGVGHLIFILCNLLLAVRGESGCV